MYNIRDIKNKESYSVMSQQLAYDELCYEIEFRNKTLLGKIHTMDEIGCMYSEGYISKKVYDKVYKWYTSYIESLCKNRVQNILGSIKVTESSLVDPSYKRILFWLEKGIKYLECDEHNTLLRWYFDEPEKVEGYKYYNVTEANLYGEHPVCYEEYDYSEYVKHVISKHPEGLPNWCDYAVLDLNEDKIIDFVSYESKEVFENSFAIDLIPLNSKTRKYEYSFKKHHMDTFEWDEIWKVLNEYLVTGSYENIIDYIKYEPINPKTIEDLTVDNVYGCISYALQEPNDSEIIKNLMKEWI